MFDLIHDGKFVIITPIEDKSNRIWSCSAQTFEILREKFFNLPNEEPAWMEFFHLLEKQLKKGGILKPYQTMGDMWSR